MGLLGWITGAVGRDLDRQVSGAEGEATARFDRLIDDAPLVVQARLRDGQRGTLLLRAQGDGSPHEERAENRLSCTLGPGRTLRAGTLTVEGTVSSAPARELAALTVEVSQPGGESSTYSVEGRPDQTGGARLRLSVSLG
jgi:hypothetical protein